tara:strand:+ start:650 stop:1054 length:405 start_codon:yes stop_codon:yes gene_type:complete
MNEQLEEFKAMVEFNIAVKKTFSVTIKAFQSLDKWNWNVYANIFESNELFNDLDNAFNLPFHGGCTYDQIKTLTPARGIQYSWQKEEKTLVLGSDYAHLHDNHDNHPSPFDRIPYEVLKDAKELVDALNQGDSK